MARAHVVFQGEAACFADQFAGCVANKSDLDVQCLPDPLVTDADRAAFADADVLVSYSYSAAVPRPARLRLIQVPGAGYEGIDFSAVPPGVLVCNTHGHESAIAEYVLGALLQRLIPYAAADSALRRNEWALLPPGGARHGELAGRTMALLGFGHIGRAVAALARAFGMRVIAANRSAVTSPLIDRYFPLSALAEFWAQGDVFCISLPGLPDTAGLVGQAAFEAMRRHAIVVNVGRGATIDEAALFKALRQQRIAGAIIDTWYQYPTPENPAPAPARLPFHDLPNVLMTPHLSAWTEGTVSRRARLLAENVNRVRRGEPGLNVIWPRPAPTPLC